MYNDRPMDLSLPIQIAIGLGTILISMTAHEMMHAFTSHWLGDDTAQMQGRLTLNPLAHIDLYYTVLLPLGLMLLGAPPIGAAKPVPFNPNRVKGGDFGAALVGIAGPLTNLILAMVAGFWLRFVIGFEAGIITEILEVFMVVNIVFFAFNMIPFPPLDGSRLLFAFAPEGVRNIMRGIEAFGLMGFFLFFFAAYYLIIQYVDWAVQVIGGLILGF